MKNISKNYPINHQIREKEVRVVASDGEQLGIMSSRDAQRIAAEKDMDLVMISANAKPPVCRVMDYGKFLYEQQKKEKEAKKKQKTVELKEIRFSLNIDDHDLSTKANNANKFLKEGNKVKVTIRFRGREAEHSQKGYALMKEFFAKVEELGIIEKPAKMEGRNMTMVVASNVK
ncbi:Translation initiation factor 3 [Clostridiaceae bacterium JG1575]|nr:Translation initiation factor 3 [Clostridiaceae bacterium JG1575]